jgi:hypothetical protein
MSGCLTRRALRGIVGPSRVARIGADHDPEVGPDARRVGCDRALRLMGSRDQELTEDRGEREQDADAAGSLLARARGDHKADHLRGSIAAVPPSQHDRLEWAFPVEAVPLRAGAREPVRAPQRVIGRGAGGLERIPDPPDSHSGRIVPSPSHGTARHVRPARACVVSNRRHREPPDRVRADDENPPGSKSDAGEPR